MEVTSKSSNQEVLLTANNRDDLLIAKRFGHFFVNVLYNPGSNSVVV